MKDLWVEKYRPKTVDGYVFRDEAQRSQVKTWIKDKTIPSAIFWKCWNWKDDIGKIIVQRIGIERFRYFRNKCKSNK